MAATVITRGNSRCLILLMIIASLGDKKIVSGSSQGGLVKTATQGNV